ncbi:apolipoprotein N-acyltransferase [Thalassotalea sp. 1_MG-2023]|uniref:apolipoprotein N-acyltransferase n=1 Tax=Thalassotalea sp. 1_MG-2023 TaxID=3062680 RepID=UPI0026E243CD|nr:apolipoprotein N-acyltransferase [Thalassotalea sp. 1_MG-2023]MDO6428248.1 apolipoprotein N-acyltransferase [Thalassotalea sp. 1_MG-2023]
MLKTFFSKLGTTRIGAMLSNISLWISALLGASLVFAYAPFSQWWLSWLVLPIWFLYVNKQCTNSSTFLKDCTKHGFAFGVGWFSAGISWVHVSIAEFGGMPLVVSVAIMFLLCLYLAIYPALALFLTAKISVLIRTRIQWWLLAPIWLFTEYLRSVVLTGFPWLSIGYTQIDAPVATLAPMIGEIGLSFIILFVAGLTADFITAKKKQYIVLPSALLAIVVWYSQTIEWVTVTGQSKRVALVQGNIAQSIKWEPEQQWPTMLKYLDLSRKHYEAEIIIWPESAIPAIETMSSTQEFLDIANQSASMNNAAIITGIINYHFESKQYFNSLVVLGNEAANDQQGGYYYNHKNRYDKNHLLPIGEFVPFGDLLRPLAPFFNLPMSSFTRGDYVQQNLIAHDTHLLALICFEIAFADQLRANFSANSDFLLTVSNDAWFGNSHGPHQHMEIARMRALEFGRPLLRSTNTGITAITNHLGEITSILPQFTQDVLKQDVALVTGLTPYSRFGNTPLYIVSLLIVLCALIRNLRMSKS